MEVGEKNLDWLNNVARLKIRVHGIIKVKSDCWKQENRA